MPIHIDNIILNKTARKEEVLAYIICKDYIFGDKDCYIGDAMNSNCPDIYTTDKTIGAEVVMCDTFSTFKNIEKYKIGNVFDNDNKIKTNPKSLYNKKYSSGLKLKQIIPPAEEYYQNLIKALNSKLENLNTNHYDGCKHLYLIVVSNLAHKDYVSVDKVFEIGKEVISNYPRHYENVYITLGSKILSIDKDLKCEVIKDFSQRQSKTPTDNTELVQ